MATTTTTYLVTGATRGIGAELVKQLLQRPNSVVIAGVRDIHNAAAKALQSSNDNLIVVQLDSNKESDPQHAVQTLTTKHGIQHVDVVIANAGIATDWASVQDVKPADVRASHDVNVIGTLVLLQAFLPLLQKSTNKPRFVAISTAIASLGYQRNLPFKALSYGASKVALNFVVVRTAIEHPDIISFAAHPGLVQTDMAADAIKHLDKSVVDKVGAITPTESASALLALIDAAGLESHSGKFFNAPEGTTSELPW